jgi:Uma2 family endonuclease
MAMTAFEQRVDAVGLASPAGAAEEHASSVRVGQGLLHFPAQAEMPETKRHLELRTLLYQILKLAFRDRAAIGCDQFVYWDPTDARACLAPDAFVRFGEADDLFRIWKVWERGAPQVAVEIASDSDEGPSDWADKLSKYRRLGVAELVRFDPAEEQRGLRVWDWVGADLVERVLAGPSAQSRYLEGFWAIVEYPDTGLALRLSHDEGGRRLFPTLAEQEADGRRAEADGRRAEADGRRVEADGRRAAERRVLELEAELRRRLP